MQDLEPGLEPLNPLSTLLPSWVQSHCGSNHTLPNTTSKEGSADVTGMLGPTQAPDIKPLPPDSSGISCEPVSLQEAAYKPSHLISLHTTGRQDSHCLSELLLGLWSDVWGFIIIFWVWSRRIVRWNLWTPSQNVSVYKIIIHNKEKTHHTGIKILKCKCHTLAALSEKVKVLVTQLCLTLVTPWTADC